MAPGTEIEKVQRDLERASSEARGLLEESSTSTDLVHVGESAVAVKRQLAHRKQAIERKRQEVEKLSEQMRELMDQQRWELEQVLEPMQEMIKRLEEGIWTVNLYLGRNESIHTLRKGEAAPADTPIHVRQLVLAMDEETAINPEDGGIDFQDISQFDEWLVADEKHVQQVIPDLKGIVAIKARNEETKDYGNPFANISAKENDEHTYFLIRNGDALYRIWSEFSVGDHMVPTADEFTNFFRERRYNFSTGTDDESQIDPDSFGYDRALREAEKRQRHYMRMGLILQGLADRTAIFHPLPEDGINFLAQSEHDAGKVRFIMDAEDTLGTGIEPFFEWLARLNRELRPGMRVVGAFNGEGFRNSNQYERSHANGHSRLNPSGASYPLSFVPLTLDKRSPNGSFTARYKRTDKKYGYYGDEGPYKKRASVTLWPEDHFILPLDFVTVEEMETYLRSRVERPQYLSMFPLLHAAIEIKKREAAEEGPFRKLIAATLVTEYDLSYDYAAQAVPALVEWWKFKNREHYPLVGSDDQDRKALSEIIAEFAKRQKLDQTATPVGLLRNLQRAHPDAILIGRRPDGYHVVLKPEDDSDVFVAIGVYTKTGKVKEQKRWKLPPRNILSWRIFYEGERWKHWRRGAGISEYLTGPEKERFAASLLTDDVIAISYYHRSRIFEVWRAEPFTIPRKPEPRYWRAEKDWACFDWPWRREQGGEAKVEEKKWGQPHHYSGKEPWSREGRKMYGEIREVLFENPKLIAKQRARVERSKEFGKECEALHSELHGIEGDLTEQLEAKIEEGRYAEFLKEYSDPELWEGHKKTLPKIRLPEDFDISFLAQLVTERRELHGMRLGDAANLTGAELNDDYGEFVIHIEPEEEEDED